MEGKSTYFHSPLASECKNHGARVVIVIDRLRDSVDLI